MEIVTALKNPNINNKLKNKKDINVFGNDIQYQEGIIEVLEENEKIDLLIISELLFGNLDFRELINIIKNINKNIEIIVILKEVNEETKNFLISKGIFDIFYNNEITVNELIKIIEDKNNKKKQNEINEEIEMLKKIVLEKNFKKNNNSKKEKIYLNNYIFNKIKNIFKRNKKHKNISKEKNKTSKIITVTGSRGVGKSSFSSILANEISNKKILLIDSNILECNINTIFGIKRDSNIIKNNNLDIPIIKVNKNIHLFCTSDYFLEKDDFQNKINYIIDKVSKIYDLIIIDIGEEKEENKKIFLKNTDLIIFLVEANLLGIKNSQILLEKYINKWNIQKEKFEIIFNKQNNYSIDKRIIKVLFADFHIIGSINLNKKFSLAINSNMKKIDKKILKDYQCIIRNLQIKE